MEQNLFKIDFTGRHTYTRNDIISLPRDKMSNGSREIQYAKMSLIIEVKHDDAVAIVGFQFGLYHVIAPLIDFGARAKRNRIQQNFFSCSITADI